MRSTVTSQVVNQIEIMMSPSGITAATRGQQIDKNCTQISKGAEMLVPEIQNRIIFLPSGA